MTEKADAERIAAFMRGLGAALSLGVPRLSWPLHLFRVDDVRAAASVLNGGMLYPRRRAELLRLLAHDSASPGVIEHTPDWCKECVRLYFRPRTPTEYRSEGFRPRRSIVMGAHRPMPIVLIFDSVPIITARGTIFTEGNASTKGCRRGDDLKFLQSIPFGKVYHDTWISNDQRDVVFRRCAEVLVENELSLTHLKHVFCRSQAEYETLYSLLDAKARELFKGRIGVSAALHYKKWSYVESAELTPTRVKFRFSPSTTTPGPFDIQFTVRDLSGQPLGTWGASEYQANDKLLLNLHRGFGSYIAELSLDNALAYRNTFTSQDALL
jgi:hypothetical protein